VDDESHSVEQRAHVEGGSVGLKRLQVGNLTAGVVLVQKLRLTNSTLPVHRKYQEAGENTVAGDD
jgi:hypothetical protein